MGFIFNRPALKNNSMNPFKYLLNLYNRLDSYSKGHLIAILIGSFFVNSIFFIQGLLAGDLMLWLLVFIVSLFSIAVFIGANID